MTKITKKVSPRQTPPRDSRYMALAFVVSWFSKDPSTRHGAVIVAEGNYPLGFGYNGPPREIGDYEINWARPDKYPYIAHAERNAINHSDANYLSGATIYVTGLPCQDCMLSIVEKGIKKVVYHSGRKYDKGSMCSKQNEKTSLDIARLGKISLVEFKNSLSWIRDEILLLEEVGIFDH